MNWRFIDTDRIDGYYSAALFESIAKHVGTGRVDETILFWRVRTPVVYLGYHQYVEDEVHEDYCAANGIQVIRRVLGGGCGFCDENQILFSVIGRENGGVIPQNIQGAYSCVLAGVVSALATLGLDGELARSRNAVYSMGRKISGNAQGRFDGAVLINGSFLLDFDFDEMDRVLRNPTKNLKEEVLYARDGMITLSDLLGWRSYDIDHVKGVLKWGFEGALGVTAVHGALTESETRLANRLVEGHRSQDWIYRLDDKRRKRLRRGRHADI
ncbi:MAG TPA: lipoate--protein ligase family protein [Methanosarcinales archaeon]|nr:lipoate--protein ligase family protein [Methanosarcinales archaeon]